MPTALQHVAIIAEQFKRLPYDFAFLGGAVLEILITDKAAPCIRTTKDVDILVNTPSRKTYTELEFKLQKMGFKHDTSEGAPICRWIFNDIVLDVMPPSKDVLGWNTRWLKDALVSATAVDAKNPSLRIVTAPYFLASKIEAFGGRGKEDYAGSHDMEDIISVVNGRETLVEEVKQAPRDLQAFLQERFTMFLGDKRFIEALDGHLADETDILQRKKRVIERLKSLVS